MSTNDNAPGGCEPTGGAKISKQIHNTILADSLPQKLLAKGFEPIPIKPREKYPTLKNWSAADCSRLVRNWPPNHGIGLRTGTVTAVDIDVHNPDVVEKIVNLLRFFCSSDLITRIGQSPKILVPLICPEIKTKITSNKWCDKNGEINQIECLSYGQQFVGFGIHPGTGKPYKWDGDLLTHVLPTISLELIKEVFAYLNTLAADRGWQNLTETEIKAKRLVSERPPQDKGDAPGQIYNRSVTIEKVLEHYGWTHYRDNYWSRPGKSSGVSGSVLGNILWCFSLSTCLKANSANDAFEVLTQYEFKGDKGACTRALRREMGVAA